MTPVQPLPAIVLLAAGEGSRFGGAKQLAAVDGTAMARRCALAALATDAPVTVVTGACGEAVAASLAGLPLAVVYNPDWRRGIGRSIACGVRAVQQQSPAAPALLLHLADLPAVTSADLDRLIAAWRAAPDRVVVAAFGSASGPPALFPRRLFAALASLDGDRGARELVAAEGASVVRVPVAGAGFDVDTPSDLAALDRG
jgi:molybdenum cofactor cytidylyltransferase